MPSLTAVNNTITRLLSPPSKIARALDWNKLTGAILSVHVGLRTVDLAVASHPSAFHPVDTLPSIPIEMETRRNQKVLKENVLLELKNIVETHKICGIVVSWPVQKEGWCGATCGKVLHVLDQVVEDTNILSAKRPMCLWDGHHFRDGGDEWGRLALYGVPTNKTIHMASKEQYKDEGMPAADIATDFLNCHWPDLTHNLNRSTGVSSKSSEMRGTVNSRI